MAKLTLSVDDAVVSRAKLFAKRQGVSISKIVEGYLDAVARPATASTDLAPILRSLRGILKNSKNADIKQYREYLEAKYR